MAHTLRETRFEHDTLFVQSCERLLELLGMKLGLRGPCKEAPHQLVEIATRFLALVRQFVPIELDFDCP